MICYFIFLLITLAIKEMSSRTRVLLAFAFSLLLFYMPFVAIRFQTQTLYSNPFVRTVEFAIGMLLASFSKEGFQRLHIRRSIFTAGLLWSVSCLFLFICLKRIGPSKDYMLYSIVFLPVWLMIIVSMKRIRIQQYGLQKVITFLGAIAYDMFLVQFFVWPVERALDNTLAFSNMQKIIFVFVLCIGMATCMHYMFERPVQNKLRGMIKNEA